MTHTPLYTVDSIIFLTLKHFKKRDKMAPSIPNVLKKVPAAKQRSGMTQKELELFFILHEYGMKKAIWDVHELIKSAQIQTRSDKKDEEGRTLWFSIYWPFSGIACDHDRLSPVIWGRRREYCRRTDNLDEYQPWILDGPYKAVSAQS